MIALSELEQQWWSIDQGDMDALYIAPDFIREHYRCEDAALLMQLAYKIKKEGITGWRWDEKSSLTFASIQRALRYDIKLASYAIPVSAHTQASSNTYYRPEFMTARCHILEISNISEIRYRTWPRRSSAKFKLEKIVTMETYYTFRGHDWYYPAKDGKLEEILRNTWHKDIKKWLKPKESKENSD